VGSSNSPFLRFLEWTERFRGRDAVFRGVSDESQMRPLAVRSFFASRGTRRRSSPISGARRRS
jgi:hypothetical protein